MATDATGITDEVQVTVNDEEWLAVIQANRQPGDEPDEDLEPEAWAAWNEARLAQQTPSLPPRPSDSAPKSAWVDYVVSLGADHSVAEDLRYYDPHGGERLEFEDFVGGYDDKPAEAVQVDVGGYTTRKALTRAELIELADRLGG